MLKIIALFLISTNLLARIGITGTGYIPRDVSSGQFYLDITVSGLEENKTEIISDLEIYISEYSSGTLQIPFSGSTEAASSQANFSYSSSQAQETTVSTEGTYSVKMYLRFDDKNSELENLMESRTQLTIKVSYDESAEESIPITKDAAVVNEAPEVTSVTGGHLKVIATISDKETVTYSTGDTKAAERVYLYAAKKNTGTISIPMLVFDSEASSDSETATCAFDTSASDGGNCVTCTNSNAYIQNKSLPSTIKTGSSKSKKVAIGGLADKDENGTDITYIVFATYEPNGLQRSKCYSAIPTKNISFSEYVDENMQSSTGDPTCFIATSAYGSRLHSDLHILRKFRDKILTKNIVGRIFIASYYNYSPRFAKFIQDKPILKSIVRTALSPVVMLSDWITSRN